MESTFPKGLMKTGRIMNEHGAGNSRDFKWNDGARRVIACKKSNKINAKYSERRKSGLEESFR